MADTKVTVDSGKYTFQVTDEGSVVCDRYDQRNWVVFDKGAKAMISLIHHAAELEERAGERPGSTGNDDRRYGPVPKPQQRDLTVEEVMAAGKIGAFIVTNNNIPIPLGETPLGRARRAIDLAHHEIDEAISAWGDDDLKPGDPPDGYPGDRAFEIELRPDPHSIGFELVLTFDDDLPATSPQQLRARLREVCIKHGVETITVRETTTKRADVRGEEVE